MPTMDDVFREALGTRQDQPAPKPGSMDAVFAANGQSLAPGRPGPSLPAVAKAAKLSPDQARRNEDLTAATGLPPRVVQADPDRAEKYAEAQRLRVIEREAPATARFLSSPGNMELARDAAAALADMERQQQAAPRKPELTFDRFLRASGQSFLQALSDRATGAAIQEKAEFQSYADVQAYQRRLASGPMPALEGETRDAGELYWDLVKANEAQGMPQEEAETKAAPGAQRPLCETAQRHRGGPRAPDGPGPRGRVLGPRRGHRPRLLRLAAHDAVLGLRRPGHRHGGRLHPDVRRQVQGAAGRRR